MSEKITENEIKSPISSADTGGTAEGSQAKAGNQPFFSQRKITRTLRRADSEQPAALPGVLLSSETEQAELYKQDGREKPGFHAEAEQATSDQVVLAPRMWTLNRQHETLMQKHRLGQPAVPSIAGTLEASRRALVARVGTGFFNGCGNGSPQETHWLIQSPGKHESVSRCSPLTLPSVHLLWDCRGAGAHGTPRTENREEESQLNIILFCRDNRDSNLLPEVILVMSLIRVKTSEYTLLYSSS